MAEIVVGLGSSTSSALEARVYENPESKLNTLIEELQDPKNETLVPQQETLKKIALVAGKLAPTREEIIASLSGGFRPNAGKHFDTNTYQTHEGENGPVDVSVVCKDSYFLPSFMAYEETNILPGYVVTVEDNAAVVVHDVSEHRDDQGETFYGMRIARFAKRGTLPEQPKVTELCAKKLEVALFLAGIASRNELDATAPIPVLSEDQ